MCSRTRVLLVQQTGLDTLLVFTFLTVRALLRNLTTLSPGIGRPSTRETLHRFSAPASFSVSSLVNSDLSCAASLNLESFNALCTSSCSTFFLLLRSTSYEVISEGFSGSTPSFPATPPWMPCLDGESIVTHNEILPP
jgi:hypothetical protein